MLNLKLHKLPERMPVKVEARFVSNDNRPTDSAPAFRIYAGRSQIGAAWQHQTDGVPPRTYFAVCLDDPCLPEPITAALFEAEDGKKAHLVWKRRE